ncbi:MAG: biotin transporter BioY [Rubellimicrobium sp.]|nr:biotin transporter BioY [Rubellimicrobium sp.]
MERTLALIALFAALLGALALMPGLTLGFGVPITLQTLGVMLAGTVLGARGGALAVLLYLGLIAIGLPIAANGGAGLAVFARPSAGYLLGFVAGALVIGLVAQRFANPMGFWPALAGALTGGVVVVHVFGIIGLMLRAGMDLPAAIAADAAFIPGDIAKAVIAAAITRGLAQARPALATRRL